MLLAVLEETLLEIEELAAGRRRSGRLLRADRDLPAGFREASTPHLERIRARLHVLADLLALESRLVSVARHVQAHLITAVVRVEDSMPDKLRRYGDVDASVTELVAPVLREIHRELKAVAQLAAPAA